MTLFPPASWRIVRRSCARCAFLPLVIVAFLAGSFAYGEIKSPEQYFGHRAGAEKKLISWDGILGYLEHVAGNSSRLQIQEIGKTTNNNPLVLAVISSPENLKNIERYKEINRKLFDPRRIPGESEAQRLVQEGRIFVLVTCSVHSNEIGPSQMSVELVHRLTGENSPQVAEILENVIFLLIPSANPDGHIMLTGWYNRTVGTAHEDAPLPRLFHPYAGHDINRDSFMFTQKETRVIGKVLYHDWMPAVWLDLHQMGSAGPRVFVMPAMDPINPNVDPLIYRNAGLLGFSQAAALERAGKTGIIYGDTYTYWWEGAMAWAGLWHNMVGLLTEIASARVAGSVEQHRAGSDWRDRRSEGGPEPIPPPADVEPRLQYPRPWLGGTWTPRDVVDHALIATWGLLESCAKLRTSLLDSLYIVGKRQIELGKEGNPFAILVPKEQWDLPAAVKLLQTLEYAGVEVHRAERAFTADGKNYPPGTYVILMSQPFRAYAKDMLEPQAYPASASSSMDIMASPYDITGWSLGMQMGVETVFVREPFQAELTRLSGVELPPGNIDGRGSTYLFSHNTNNSLVAVNRLLDRGFEVDWLTGPVTVRGKSYGPGSIRVSGGKELESAMNDLARTLGIDAMAAEFPFADALRIRAPRTALYQPWGGNMDEGWTRWLLEQYEFAFETVHPEDLREGDLLKRHDVIIFPDMSAAEIINGLNVPEMPEEYRGGIDRSGIGALRRFIETGGTVIGLGRSAALLMDELGAPYRNALRGVSRGDFLCPGSILRILVDTNHPIAYGMKPEASGYFINSLALQEIAPGSGIEGTAVVRYPESGILKSGWLKGEDYLRGRIAAAEVKYGRGRMILLPLRVQHRAQSHETFKLLFNSILTSASEPAGDLRTAVEAR